MLFLKFFCNRPRIGFCLSNTNCCFYCSRTDCCIASRNDQWFVIVEGDKVSQDIDNQKADQPAEERTPTRSIDEQSESRPSESTTKQRRKLRLLDATVISGLLGVIIVAVVLIRNNTGINVEWEHLPNPDNSPIVEVLVDNENVLGVLIRVKTQSGRYYIADPNASFVNCWSGKVNTGTFLKEKML